MYKAMEVIFRVTLIHKSLIWDLIKILFDNYYAMMLRYPFIIHQSKYLRLNGKFMN